MAQRAQGGLVPGKLPPLSSEGCGVPMLALARAKYLRGKTLEVLWSECSGGEERARFLDLVREHQEAHWWCKPTTTACLAFFRQRLAMG